MNKSLVPLVSGLLALVAVGCFGPPADVPKPLANPAVENSTPVVTNLVVRETSLGKLQEGLVARSIVVSPDGTRFAFVVGKQGSQRVILDGRPQPEYVSVLHTTLRFSPDSKRFAYGAVVGTPDKPRAVVVIDEQRPPEFEDVSQFLDGHCLTFSPDSQHVIYAGIRKGQVFAVVDGKEGKPHSGLGISSDGIVWSRDSKRWGMAVLKEDKPNRLAKSSYLIDDQESPVFDSILKPVGGNEALTVVVDNTIAHPIVFSRDGKHVAYMALDGDHAVLFKDGKELARQPSKRVVRLNQADGKGTEGLEGGFTGFWFSPDGERLVYVVERKVHESWYVVDGKPHKEFPVLPIANGFSQDSKHFGYVAVKRPALSVIIDGEEKYVGEAPPEVLGFGLGNFTFSPDGTRWAARAARKGKVLVTVDGKDGPAFHDVQRPMFSPDSKRVFHIGLTQEPRAMMVLDGEAGPHLEDYLAGQVFSPDSRHVCVGAKSDNTWRLMVDDFATREAYDGFIGQPPRWLGPNKVRVVALRDVELIRVDVEVESADLTTVVADLKAKDGTVRKKAAATLERLGRKARAVAQALVEALDDKDPDVGETATGALLVVDPTNKALEALLRKASVDGKYARFLKRIKVPQDKENYGEFSDYGTFTGTKYAGFDNLPTGYWVYVSPHWYIWGEEK